MKTSRWVLIVVVASVLTATAGGAAAWWTLRSRSAAAAAAADEPHAAASAPAAVDKRPQKYVSLDKVIVMLRREPGDTTPHYLAMDLVLKSPDEQEKLTKEHLPMLRSVAVKALSGYSAVQAGTMTIDQFTAVINSAYAESYQREQHEKPFSEAMIGKLIVE